MKYRALLFDWSGTLVDDLPPTLHATNVVLKAYDVPTMCREEFRERFRLPYPEFYEELLPGVTMTELEGLFRTAFRESPVGVTPLPYAREILTWCREEQVRCFVLSSMDEGLFMEQARAFGLLDYFEEVYAGVIDKRERIGEILNTHNLEPSTTAFLGDMSHDVATAKHGGIDSLALTSGYDPAERLAKAVPTKLFEHLREVHDYFQHPASVHHE